MSEPEKLAPAAGIRVSSVKLARPTSGDPSPLRRRRGPSRSDRQRRSRPRVLAVVGDDRARGKDHLGLDGSAAFLNKQRHLRPRGVGFGGSRNRRDVFSDVLDCGQLSLLLLGAQQPDRFGHERSHSGRGAYGDPHASSYAGRSGGPGGDSSPEPGGPRPPRAPSRSSGGAHDPLHPRSLAPSPARCGPASDGWSKISA
jgi:hypothetical protein